MFKEANICHLLWVFHRRRDDSDYDVRDDLGNAFGRGFMNRLFPSTSLHDMFQCQGNCGTIG